jgi:hypothetical protein
VHEWRVSGRVGVPAAGGIILETVDSRFGVSAGFLRCPECSRWMLCGEQGGTSSGALYSNLVRGRGSFGVSEGNSGLSRWGLREHRRERDGSLAILEVWVFGDVGISWPFRHFQLLQRVLCCVLICVPS